jgi:hypothetical protein
MRRLLSPVALTLFVTLLLTAGLTSVAFAGTPALHPHSPRPGVPAVPSRITQPVNESQITVMPGNVRPEARNPQNDRGKVADSMPVEHVWLQLQRSAEQERALQELIDQLNDRNSRMFHQWLTPEQFGEYGVGQEDIETVTNWMESHGLRVNQVYPNHMLIDFSGTAGQLRDAFHTEIHQLEVNGKKQIANLSDPYIPAALSPVVHSIVALNDFQPHRTIKPRPDYTFAGCTSGASSVTEPGTCYAVTPLDNAVIYNLNPMWSNGYSGQGQTIAVIESTDMYNFPGDWNSYRTAFGLTGYTGTLSQLHPGSCTDPGAVATSGEESEANLDVEVATGFAPSAAVQLLSCTAGTFGFGGQVALENVLNAAGPYPGVVGMSYGECEVATGAGGNKLFYNTFQQAASQGVSVFVSTGDDGAAGCSDEFGLQYGIDSVGVTGWGETPYNVAVGGTDFEDVFDSKIVNTAGGQSSTVPLSTYWSASNGAGDGSALSYVPEIPWNDSCASAVIADYVEGTYTTAGTTGFCNKSPGNTSTGYISLGAASGGASNCATGVAATSGDYTDWSSYLITTPYCQGYAKPSFQTGAALTGGNAVYGTPNDGLRDIPDVSLFAANGVWGHYEVVCWSDTADSADGAVSCSGAPSTWSGFGGTSVATPAMAGIQALVNQYTGQSWGSGVLNNYYQMGQNEYGTAGGTFAGSTCNSSAAGGPASSCVFNDVTQGDIDLACAYNGTLSESQCYPSNETPSYNSGIYGTFSTDNVTAVTIVNGGTGYTSAPTCTIAGPSNAAPYISPTGTTLFAGGTQATCTALTSPASPTAVWTVQNKLNPSADSYVGLQLVVGGTTYTYVTGVPTAANQVTVFTTSTATTNETDTAKNLEAVINNVSTQCATTGCVFASQVANASATATETTNTVTLTAKNPGYAGNFNVSLGAAAANEAGIASWEALEILNTVLGQGPNYVSSITITGAGSGYAPETPITITGVGSGAVAIANTSFGTAAQSYQPAYGAAKGWDMATGLGSPNAKNLACSSVWGAGSGAPCPQAQTITVTTAPPASAVYNSSFNVAATASSGLPVAVTSSGACSGSGTSTSDSNVSITMTSGTGTCSVSFNQAGNGSYLAAPTVTDTASATPASQTITVTIPAPGSASDGSMFPVAATASSSLAVAITSDGVVCSGSGTSSATITMISSTGTCNVYFNQAGNANYSAAALVTNQTSASTEGTTTSVNCAPSSTAYGASTLCTATVTGANGLVKGHKRSVRRDLTGTVSWSGNTGCSSSSVSGDPATATCSTSALGIGSDTVTATYGGDGNNNGSNGSFSQTVTQASTSISVTSVSPASEDYGTDAQVTITAQLTWSGTGTAPTGSNVTIGGSGLSGSFGTTSCGAAVSNTITCTNTYNPTTGDLPGSYTMSGSFSGDSNYTASSSAQTNNFTINTETTTTSVITGGSPSTYGQPVTFTATVTSENGNVRRRGQNVKSMQLSGSVTWSSFTGCAASSISGYPGTATCTTSILPVGTDHVHATYSGDSEHGGSTGDVAQTVNQASTTIDVTNVSPSSEDFAADSPVTITAVLSWAGTGTAPTGSDVTIGGNGNGTYGTTSCGSAVSNTITCTATYTPTNADTAGSYTETAAFAGDTRYTASTSPETNNFAISTATSTTGASCTPNPSSYGQSVTCTATINGENGFVKGRRTRRKPLDITGSVAWSSNTGCGTTSVTSGNPGIATCTTTVLPAGSDTVTATYSGDSNHSGSSGNTDQVVGSGGVSVNITSVSPSNEDYGNNATVTITATLSWSGNAGAPTASDVTIGGNGPSSYGATSCGSPVSDSMNCTASYTPTSADVANTYTESASFSGDNNYGAASSPQTNNFTINQATAGTTVGCTPPTSTYGGSVTCTATINGEFGLLKGHRGRRKPLDVTGTVAWSSNTGCGTTNVTSGNPGTATCTTSTLPAGSDTVTANYSGDSNHSGSSGSGNENVSQATQTITITQGAPSSAPYNSSFNVAGTGGASGNGVVFSTSGSCSGSGTGSASITMTSGTGTCSVFANQAGNSNYSAAPQVTQNVNATKLSQSISFTTPAPPSAAYNSSFGVAAGATSTLGVSIATSGSCSGSGTNSATVTMTSGVGTCSVTASQSGDSNYNAASSVTETTSATPASQSINVSMPAPPDAAKSTSFMVAASASSGLPVAYTSSGNCTNGGTQTYTMGATTASCSVIFNQAGNTNYAAATTVTEITHEAAAVTCSACTVTGAPTSDPYLYTFTVGTTSGSDISVPVLTASGACTISGTTVTMSKGNGTCTVIGTWAANYAYKKTIAKAQTTATQGVTVTTITSNTPNPCSTTPCTVAVDFSVAHSPSNPTYAIGTVTVTASTGEHCSHGLTNGIGTCNIVFHTTGSRTLTAVYGGNGNNAPSTSASVSQGVN